MLLGRYTNSYLRFKTIFRILDVDLIQAEKKNVLIEDWTNTNSDIYKLCTNILEKIPPVVRETYVSPNNGGLIQAAP